MNTLIIGCKTLENELRAAVAACSVDYKIQWIEARLHNSKPKLKAALQHILDQGRDYNRYLFATGFCGNAVSGLRSREAELIIPRVDDCTALFFDGKVGKAKYLDAYFLTEGWLAGKPNIWDEYQYSVEKYGKSRGKKIFQYMLAHYSRIVLMDTGCYEVEPALKKAREIADAFELECEAVPVGIDYLKLLLQGPWSDDRFLIVPPNSEITSEDLYRTY